MLMTFSMSGDRIVSIREGSTRAEQQEEPNDSGGEEEAVGAGRARAGGEEEAVGAGSGTRAGARSKAEIPYEPTL